MDEGPPIVKPPPLRRSPPPSWNPCGGNPRAHTSHTLHARPSCPAKHRTKQLRSCPLYCATLRCGPIKNGNVPKQQAAKRVQFTFASKLLTSSFVLCSSCKLLYHCRKKREGQENVLLLLSVSSCVSVLWMVSVWGWRWVPGVPLEGTSVSGGGGVA